MKREGSTFANISNAVLATRYLALQELREKVRRVEERFASGHEKKVLFLKPNSRSQTQTIAKNQRL